MLGSLCSWFVIATTNFDGYVERIFFSRINMVILKLYRKCIGELLCCSPTFISTAKGKRHLLWFFNRKDGKSVANPAELTPEQVAFIEATAIQAEAWGIYAFLHES
jgi:hypothetical protein